MNIPEIITIRQAKQSDIDFIIEGIIEAEKGGKEIIPTQIIFNLTFDELCLHYKDFLLEDIEDCEFSLKSYIICDVNGIKAGTISSWIEGLSGFGSNLIKMNCWIAALPRNHTQTILKNIELANKYSIPRKKDYLQLEYLYVKEDFRKRGLHKRMIASCIERAMVYKNLKGCQAIPFKETILSYNFFVNRKFKEFNNLEIKDDAFGNIFEHRNRVSMEIEHSQLSDLIKSLN